MKKKVGVVSPPASEVIIIEVLGACVQLPGLIDRAPQHAQLIQLVVEGRVEPPGLGAGRRVIVRVDVLLKHHAGVSRFHCGG